MEFFANAYENYNLELNFDSKIYFGRNDFKYISPSHFSFYWEGFYYFKNFFIYYTHHCENGIDKNAYDNRRWDLFGIGFGLNNFKFIIGHVVSPFRTSYDNQNYTWGFKLKGNYKFLDIYYILVYTKSANIKNELSLRFNYPIYISFERRMDMKSMYDRYERNFYSVGFSSKKPFQKFEFYNLFRFNLEPSYNVLYIAKFGYRFINFEIEGLSAYNRWTPQFLIFNTFLCKSLCLKWFSKHQLDLNYLNDKNYTFDNSNNFPFSIAIGYNDDNFGIFYSFIKRNIKELFEIILSYRNFTYKLYFDEAFSFESSYYFAFTISPISGTKLVLGLFKNNFLNFDNVFFGIYLTKNLSK